VRSHLRQILLLGVALACSLPAAALAARSPADLLASILAAGRAQRSAHFVNTISIGAVRIRLGCDAAPDRGVEHVTFRKNGRTGHLTVIVSKDTAYIRGDAFALVNYEAFKPAPAAKYAGHWVRIPHSDRDYSTVSAGLRLSSVIDELTLVPVSKAADAMVSGERVVGLTGARKSAVAKDATVTLYARAAGAPLPVQEVTTQGNARATVTFGKWNETVNVTAPANAVPIAKTGLE
jgi:hypothetical protein